MHDEKLQLLNQGATAQKTNTMAILLNQEIHFARLTATRFDPNRLDPTKPNWGLQCRTTDKAVRKQWIDMGIKPRTVRVDPADEESDVLYYSVNFRKNVWKMVKATEERTKNTPPEVVNGKQVPIDGNSIGNGSIANLKLRRREFELAGVKKVAYTLLGVQVVKHLIYVGEDMEDFGDCETETILPGAAPAAEADESDLY